MAPKDQPQNMLFLAVIDDIKGWPKNTKQMATALEIFNEEIEKKTKIWAHLL